MENTDSGINKFLVPAAVVLAGLFIAGAVMWNGSHPVGTSDTAAAPSVNIKDVNTNGLPFIGQADAPVTIAFWSDYQCPYCKAFEVGGVNGINIDPALPEIIKNYVDTGKVKVVFFDFPFLGQDSVTAAEYNQSIWKLYPDQYFAWRTAMYNAQDQEGDQGFGNAASIDKLNATIPGLDAAKITADVAANKAAYDAQASAERAEGQKFGINATPSFIIGEQMVPGAAPFSSFQTLIEAQLAK